MCKHEFTFIFLYCINVDIAMLLFIYVKSPHYLLDSLTPFNAHAVYNSCINMGRPSPLAKKRKRINQKVKRKVKFGSDPSNPGDCISVNNDTNITSTKQLVPILDDCLGEDSDTVMMQTEDKLLELEADQRQSKHSYEYLLECRKTLMQKVTKYRAQVEKLTTESTQMSYRH